MKNFRFARSSSFVLAVCAFAAVVSAGGRAAAADQIYFTAVTDVASLIVQRIKAETVRIDVSAWYLTQSSITDALIARHNAGVQVRVIGDRGAIFEIDAHTRAQFYALANAGVPVRLRYNPTWFPEIDHMKMAYFKNQGVVEFGSANWEVFALTPFSSTNYVDETVIFTDDPQLVGAFASRFDQIWNDTTNELYLNGDPASVYGGPPYLKNWNDACALESACSDYHTLYPNPAPMVINTGRQEPDNATPPDLIWSQGRDFNNRLVTEINNEPTRIKFVIYRLTVDNITNALLAKAAAGKQVQVIIEPSEYLNRKWPEFWLTHANVDKLWAAGISIKMRKHDGMTHMKMLVTSSYATNASSNYAAAWQRDNNYFVPAATKFAIYSAMSDRFDTMWADTAGFTDFVPQGPDTPSQMAPGNGATAISQTPTLAWSTAVFATSYDVYLGTSASNMTLVGNVPAQLANSVPSQYTWTPSAPLAGGTTYFWKVVARTNATVRNPSLVGPTSTWSFTTSGTAGTPPPPPPTSNVPAPWTTSDIGSVGLTGSATYASTSGVFTVNGAGADIWGASDSFRYVYQPVSGDTQIVARVTSEQNTSGNAKAAVMFRESLGVNAAHVILDVSPTGNVEFMVRSTTGGATTWLTGATQAFPAWLKLVRSGTTVTASISSDGNAWTSLGTTTLSTAAYAGLAVCSHNTSALNTSTFDNVSVTAGAVTPPPPPPPSSLPAPWVNGDVGSVGLAGSASVSSSGVFTVTGAGADIWGTADSFQFVRQSLSGDGQIVVHLASEQNTNTFAKAGVMLRDGTGANAANVLLAVSPAGNVEFMRRSSTGASTEWLAGASQAPPAWLKLARSGSTVTGYVSSNGSTWTTVGSTTTSIPSTALVGLIVCSHNTNALNTSTFDNVSVTAGATPTPPPPTTATDIVIYADDVPAGSLHGSWAFANDATSPLGRKLATPDVGYAQTSGPLASPTHYVDVIFQADAGVSYRFWMRMQAAGNSKLNDSVFVQFSDAQANGAPVYEMNKPSGLVVNLATDSGASSLNAWGWQNGAYWLSQPTIVTFATSGQHTLRIQVREDGVAFDQLVLSPNPATFLNSSPGKVGGDTVIVGR